MPAVERRSGSGRSEAMNSCVSGTVIPADCLEQRLTLPSVRRPAGNVAALAESEGCMEGRS